MPQIKPGTEWETLYGRLVEIAPEAFLPDGQVLNLVGGEWGQPGNGKQFISPVDGSPLARFPFLDVEAARNAVRLAADEHGPWSQTPLEERKRRVTETLESMKQHRELLALLLVWEIGKPFNQSLVSVDRCISGVEWYVQEIDSMLHGRQPLGLISNIASWNYPLSVLVHALLIQLLAGNSVIAKTPSDGGLCAVTLSMALARRCGLPVSLVSGSGGQLSEALVRNDAIACLSFVGGKANGRDIAASLYDRDKRYMLEMEGVNAFGIWNYSDWDALKPILRKGFEYGKQRCTAYPRYVIQRDLFPDFLRTYLPVVQDLDVGHPLLVENAGDPLPTLDFGPLINSDKVEELDVWKSELKARGGLVLFEGELKEENFLPGQDISAYYAPGTIMNVPHNSNFYHREPFGPVDSLVVVDSIEELIAEMNVSGGSLVASVACDDPKTAQRINAELRAFKVGYNGLRSRGDRDEAFGGIGQSWKGCFVGGRYLVQAVTQGQPGERLYGNFPDYTLLPEVR
jgi:acyl-CoA reductase-like NAD-dependent aldehyde dehydrogenase